MAGHGIATQRVVLVTGATGGLGPAVVDGFQQAGYLMVPVARGEMDHPLHIRADLGQPGAAETVAATVRERHGRLDVLADVMGGWRGGQPASATDDDTWTFLLELNLLAKARLYRAALPLLHQAEEGRLLCVGAKAGLHPTSGNAAYAASKAALHALIQTIAAERPHLRFSANVVAPGTLDTDANRAAMPHADRAAWVPPASLAALLLTLAAPGTSLVNGQVVAIG